jgi:hypothetical protein
MNVFRIVLIAFFARPLVGQTVPSHTQAQQEREIQEIRDRYVNEARREAIKSLQPTAPRLGDTGKLKKSIDQFSTAVDQYRTAVNEKSGLEQPLKNMEKALVDLEKYFKTPFKTAKTPKVDKAAYDRLSPVEFAAETLKSADRLKADLPALLKIAQDPFLLMTPDARQFLAELEHEGLLLKYLAPKSRPAKAK